MNMNYWRFIMAGRLSDMYKTLDDVFHGGIGANSDSVRIEKEENDARQREEEDRRKAEAEAAADR